MTSITVLSRIIEGLPSWLKDLTPEEYQQVNFVLVSRNQSSDLGLYTIIGSKRVLNKIATLPDVVKVCERDREELKLDELVFSKMRELLVDKVDAVKVDTTAYKVCENLCEVLSESVDAKRRYSVSRIAPPENIDHES
ncbi:MAG: hypothetical protein K6T85_01720 [Gorillibacterium sp.]|nr:hypothetical protein [Gorillibacterium sp.]